MNLRTVRTILQKELLDTLRDKRTLLMMLGVPIILYPAMLIFGMQAAIMQQTKLDETRSRVGVQGPAAETLREWLAELEMVDPEIIEEGRAALLRGDLEALVSTEAPLEPALSEGGSVDIAIFYDSTEFKSSDAASRLEAGLRTRTRELREERLRAAGLDPAYIEPLKVQRENIAPLEKTTGTLLGSILPLLMVLMIALGAFYPAIDLTAGEKERGTFETLLSTPATKMEIVSGKFLTVFLLAMATGVLNLGSMSITFLFVIRQFAASAPNAEVLQQLQLPLHVFFFMLLVMVPLGFLLSAVMMSVAVFARSFKEAQNYVTPFFLIILLPAFLATIPGTELSSFTQFVPIYNVILLFKELMTGKSGLEAAGAVFVSTAAFAGIALWFAAWLFQREEVVLSEERGIPLSFRRGEFRPRKTLTPGSALGWYALMLILMFYLGSPLQQWKLIPGLLITQFGLMLGLTLVLLWFLKIAPRSALNLRVPSPLGVLAALLTGAGAILLLMEFSTYHNQFLPIPKTLEEEFTKLFKTEHLPGGVFTLLFAIGLTPALCEEFFMRGAVLSGVRERLGPWSSILLVGFLFGLLHISIYRIVPTAVLGGVITYLVVRTGSIWVGVLVHGINNCFAVLLVTGHVPGFVNVALNVEEFEASGLPLLTLGVGVVLAVTGVMLTEWEHRRPKRRFTWSTYHE